MNHKEPFTQKVNETIEAKEREATERKAKIKSELINEFGDLITLLNGNDWVSEADITASGVPLPDDKTFITRTVTNESKIFYNTFPTGGAHHIRITRHLLILDPNLEERFKALLKLDINMLHSLGLNKPRSIECLKLPSSTTYYDEEHEYTVGLPINMRIRRFFLGLRTKNRG